MMREQRLLIERKLLRRMIRLRNITGRPLSITIDTAYERIMNPAEVIAHYPLRHFFAMSGPADAAIII